MDGREDSLDQWNAKIGEAMQIRAAFYGRSPRLA